VVKVYWSAEDESRIVWPIHGSGCGVGQCEHYESELVMKLERCRRNLRLLGLKHRVNQPILSNQGDEPGGNYQGYIEVSPKPGICT
jgi:hypothetical protein